MATNGNLLHANSDVNTALHAFGLNEVESSVYQAALALGPRPASVIAHRAGLKRVLLPARNQKDFEDVPDSARSALEFVWLETVDDAIRTAFGNEGCADQEARQGEPASV